ncbi:MULTISPECIES: DUF3102 domain-containing protein [unclassified Methylobacterium]|uniref:DUF3102 domain-containing protein n=1 Tax=unclassified Methylobacterium TaxID=2615210 RepID=UPI0036F83D50
MSAIELVLDLPFLAGEINDAHRQVTFHARGMLLEAKRAGDALLAAKGKVRHGEFKAWVEANCRCSYQSAARYMQVAKRGKNLNLETFDGGLVAFLEAHAKPRPTAPVTFPALDPEDAERVLKINGRAERGVGAETAVASAKLASIAEDRGMTVEALLERSKAMCPDRAKSAGQAASDALEEAMRAADARLAECEARIERIVQRRAELTAEFTRMTKAELLSTAVELTLIVEGV